MDILTVFGLLLAIGGGIGATARRLDLGLLADGLGDLRRRLVRTIGDAEIRFREDPIRILRAIKFAARLDFEIEVKTLKALERTKREIPRAASARVLEEINRTNFTQALGEAFSLLEQAYRGADKAITLRDGTAFFIPADTTIVATMNTK